MFLSFFLHLAVCFQKNNESDCSDKKNDHTKFVNQKCTQQVGWLAHTVNSWPITQRTCTHACQGGLHNQRLGWLIDGHARIRQEQASSLMFQARNLVSTRSMVLHALLIWLGINKMNVQLYTISKQPCTLFEGVWWLLTVSNPNIFQNCIEYSESFSH